MSDVESVTKNNTQNQNEFPERRTVEHPTSYLQTLMHLLKGCLGTGILAMPSAFSKAGWLVGIVGTIAVGFICTYAIHMLIKSEKELSRRRKVKSLTYQGALQAAFEDGPHSMTWLAPYAAKTSKISFLLGIVGGSCIYVVFVATNLKAVIDEYQSPEDRLNVRWYMLMVWLPLTLINWVRYLKYLAPFSSVGTAASLFSYGIAIYYMFQDLPPLSTREPFGTWGGFPQFFVTAMFAMESIAVVMPLKNEMRHPEQFGSPLGVLNVAMVPNLIIFMAIGFFGYLKYGHDVKPSVTLSLPDGELLARVSRLLLVMSIFITHPLQMFMAYDIAWNEYLEPHVKKNKLLGEYVLRTVMVMATVGFAATIPYLDLIIELLGALFLTTLGLMVPALIQLFTWWHDVHGVQFIMWSCKNYFIILVGAAGFIIGTSTALKEIVDRMANGG